jgi:hypothetical protein
MTDFEPAAPCTREPNALLEERQASALSLLERVGLGKSEHVAGIA